MKWRKIKFRKIDAMVFDGRPETFPEKYPYRYGIRHHSMDFDDPRTIETYVLVNYWGTIATVYPLKINGIMHLSVRERDIIRGRS